MGKQALVAQPPERSHGKGEDAGSNPASGSKKVIRMLTRKPVLLLNSCFEPIRIISVRQALKMLTKGKVSVVLSMKPMIYPGVYRPSVIRLVEYKYIPVRMQVVTKKSIYLRDNHTCQYCSRRFHGSELTLDHVLPRSRGGRNTWEKIGRASCRERV